MRTAAVMIVSVMLACGCQQKEEDKLPDEPGKITVIQGESTGTDNLSPLIGYNVKGEYQVQFTPTGEEDNTTTRMVGAAAVSRNAPYSAIGRRLAEKSLGKDYTIKCAPCHDDYANGVIGPSLLGKTPDEIYNMIIKYQKDQETNYLMQVFVNKMTDEEIKDLAVRIAEFNKMMQESKNE